MCCISFISGKAEIMSSGRPSTQYYERRKKSCRDVDVGKGSSRDPPLRIFTREEAHKNLPRGRMAIDAEIEDEEEPLVESSDDDDIEDETYRISLSAAQRTVLDDEEDEDMDDADDIEDALRRKWKKGEFTLKQLLKSPFAPSQP
jgi:hypothetical protein